MRYTPKATNDKVVTILNDSDVTFEAVTSLIKSRMIHGITNWTPTNNKVLAMVITSTSL